MKRLFSKLNNFLIKIAVISDPKLQELSKLPSFAAKVRFCDANFQKIKAGSSRIGYHYNNDYVLKLAKNEKGQAQIE